MLVWLCLFPLPLCVWEGLGIVIVELPGLFPYLFSYQNEFSYYDHDGHPGFPIETILAIFALQDTQMLPTKFQVDWPFGSGVKWKNIFLRQQPWWPSWISNRNNFSYF